MLQSLQLHFFTPVISGKPYGLVIFNKVQTLQSLENLWLV